MQNIRGFGLLELLISIFVLSFGLLGMAWLYLHSFKRAEDSLWNTLAILEIMAIKEKEELTGNCKDLLPYGECEYSGDLAGVCWGELKNRRCLNW